MKTNKFLPILILLITILLGTAGCKNSSSEDEESDAISLTQQKILGRWNLVEFIEETTVGNQPPEIINNDPQNIYFEFLANGRVKTNAEGEEEYSYVVKPDNIMILWEKEQKIMELTQNKFTFSNTATEGNTTYKQTYFLTR
ncbi:hypothetical protein JET18_08575 [Chryseobacterium sp. L7]|uniref:Lipocalin-like domain-containing protein n=1 Tax=Chryseobacterium endalhagicum TaxID=2797638 RepID=A0ABS1QE63_9FLAO|nr:hypothetical protein [Chryseobacterium endalhagicum]MBL1220889.1 hypothetical protein [Chryseobacterium endalhagicum]